MFSDGLMKKTKVKSKKKPRRRLDSSGGYNLSDIIQSSPTEVIQSPPSVGKCFISFVHIQIHLELFITDYRVK